MNEFIGKSIAHYRILERVGQGGMGIVYKAEDTRLNRIVALKFLPPQMIAGSREKARFLREARAAAALDHPNIATVYEIGETAGQTFISMTFIEGMTLKERLKTTVMEIPEVVGIATQIAEGLKEAHQKGVIHRDIKSANIMINSRGQVKITDFGLAKLKGEASISQPGAQLGTAAYMSPEQVKGKPADQQSDIFSFGIVLYEMLTGQLPFGGESDHAVMFSIINDPPPPVDELCPKVPPVLEQIVSHCLEKKPANRYQTIDDVLEELRLLTLEKPPPGQPQAVWRKTGILWRKQAYLYSGIAILLFILIIVGLYFYPGRGAAIESIAVLPLENFSGDPNQEYFADGMTDALISNLAKISTLRVISRTSVMRYKNTDMSLPEIARELNVEAIIEGSVAQTENGVQITAQLIDAASDEHLWVDSYQGGLRDILALQSEVARAIAREIKITLTPEEEVRLASSRPVNPEAYQAYLRSRYYFYKYAPDANKKALEYAKLAVEKDPNYVLAYIGLADAHGQAAYWGFASPKEVIPKVRALALKAVEMDDALGEAHGLLGASMMYTEWDWVGAERELKRAIELNPSDAHARTNYTMDLATMGRLDEAMAEIERALKLNPLSLTDNAILGWFLYVAGEYEQAIEQYQKTLELDPNFPNLHWYLWRAFRQKGMDEEAISVCEKTYSLWGNHEVVEAIEGGYAEAGYRGAMRRAAEKLVEQLELRYVPPSDIAMLYAHAEEKEQAIHWLEKAYQEHDLRLHTIGVDPDWAILHPDPRFTNLLKKMGLDK